MDKYKQILEEQIETLLKINKDIKEKTKSDMSWDGALTENIKAINELIKTLIEIEKCWELKY